MFSTPRTPNRFYPGRPSRLGAASILLVALALAACSDGSKKEWAEVFEPALSNAVAIASNGDTLIAGALDGPTTMGGTRVHTIGGGFVARFGASGKLRWARTIEGRLTLAALAVDADDNIYAAGTYQADLGYRWGDPDDEMGFLAALTPDGEVRWSKYFGGSGPQFVHAIALTTDGSVAIAGTSYGSVDFGGGSVGHRGTYTNDFVATFDTDGNHQWSRRFSDGSRPNDLYCITAMPDGGLAIAAYFPLDEDFGSGSLAPDASDEFSPMVVAFDASGNYRFAWTISPEFYPRGIAISADGERVYVTGSNYSDGVDGVVVAGYTLAGEQLWSHAARGGYGHGITATDQAVILIGRGSGDFNLGGLAYRGFAHHFFVAAFESESESESAEGGAPLWGDLIEAPEPRYTDFRPAIAARAGQIAVSHFFHGNSVLEFDGKLVELDRSAAFVKVYLR